MEATSPKSLEDLVSAKLVQDYVKAAKVRVSAMSAFGESLKKANALLLKPINHRQSISRKSL